jgi:hypothetical protein
MLIDYFKITTCEQLNRVKGASKRVSSIIWQNIDFLRDSNVPKPLEMFQKTS